MAWTAVTIRRRGDGVGMPERCAYCYGTAQQDMIVRARRVTGRTKGAFTITSLEEHLAVPVPFCAAHAERSLSARREARLLAIGAGVLLALIGLVLPFLFISALDIAVVLGLLLAGLLGTLGFFGAALGLRRLPRYRDLGATLLGVDLAAGAEALTFRFTNPTFAAAFRTRNGLR